MIAWLPILLSPILVNSGEKSSGRQLFLDLHDHCPGNLSLVSLAIRRSLQDRLACTYLVPKGESWETELASKGQEANRLGAAARCLAGIARGDFALVFHSAKFGSF